MKQTMKQRCSCSLIVGLFCINLNLNIYLVESESSERSALEQTVAEFMDKYNGSGTGISLESWEEPEEMRRNLPYYLSGFDEDNRPIWIAEWGKWDVKKFIEAGGEVAKNYDMYADKMVLRMINSALSRSTPEHPIEDIIFIIDLDGFPLEQLTSAGALLYNVRKLGSWTSFAAGIEKGFVLNTNFFAERALNFVKPYVGAAIDRFEIYGTNKEKWIPKLLKHVPRSQLPEWYGGEKDFKPIEVHG